MSSDEDKVECFACTAPGTDSAYGQPACAKHAREARVVEDKPAPKGGFFGKKKK